MRTLSAFAAALLLGLAVSSSRAAGIITLIPNGAVDVRQGAAGSWRPVTGEESISAGQEVRTHKNSTAQLVFSDGSRVQINNFSIFAVDKTDVKEASFSLKLGKIRAAFAGLLSSRVSIRTPTAVCAVRGTVFDVGVDAKNTTVTMAEGVLEVKDNNGKQAVVTSEETLNIGENGIEKPHMIALNDPRALSAVRPYAVHQEMARDATRRMLEDVRNRELKANEAQLGKDVTDAFGRRVRLEEYLLRPDTKSFEILFLSKRQDRFDWGHFIETFHGPIPNDLSQVPAIVASGFLAKDQPTNWLKTFEFYATNTVDADKEVMKLGDPVKINFAGYGAGNLWYPSSIDFTQTLIGPGVPGGARDQFFQHQDYNVINAGLFTFSQSVQPTAGVNTALIDGFGNAIAANVMIAKVVDPTDPNPLHANSPANANGGNTISLNLALFNNTNSVTTTPGGPNSADLRSVTTYADGSTVSVEKFLVSNDGKTLDFSNPASDLFNTEGNYNLEINIKSSLFQGRDIDVLVAPEILRQKKQDTATADVLKP